jgi:hypothetical protein
LHVVSYTNINWPLNIFVHKYLSLPFAHINFLHNIYRISALLFHLRSQCSQIPLVIDR